LVLWHGIAVRYAAGMSTVVATGTGLLGRRLRAWSRLSLPRQYALASFPVLIVGMLGLGAWVTGSIEGQVIQNTAVNNSLYVNSFISPELQELTSGNELSEEKMRAIESMLADTPLGRRIKSVKVWVDGGRIAYYTRHELIGRVFEPTPNLRLAWTGEVTSELSSLADEEDSAEHGLGIPLLEVYMPVLERNTDRVIAVAEFYQDARELEERLEQTRRRTWLVVTLVTLAMYGTLFGIVHAGGRTIRRQGKELRVRVMELSRLLAQNERLRMRVGRATRRNAEIHEHQLRRLSADLHDGPAQALGLALLRLDAVGDKQPGDDEARGGELEQIRDRLQEALAEIRTLCRGLTLPELEGLGIEETLDRAVSAHRRRTRTEVELECADLENTADVSMPIKITAYRVTQEALTNAFRHADGRGQQVRAKGDGRWLQLAISDAGTGIDGDPADASRSGRLGLKGLRDRVESLGGQFEIDSIADRGTTVRVVLPLEEGN
jgi:signal transduction histidine kinase